MKILKLEATSAISKEAYTNAKALREAQADLKTTTSWKALIYRMHNGKFRSAVAELTPDEVFEIAKAIAELNQA